jgi:hypothetical protein
MQAPVTTIKPEVLQVILTIEKYKVSLFISTGANISAIPFSPGPGLWDILGQPLERYFTQSLDCSWGDFHFYYTRTSYSSAMVRPSI